MCVSMCRCWTCGYLCAGMGCSVCSCSVVEKRAWYVGVCALARAGRHDRLIISKSNPGFGHSRLHLASGSAGSFAETWLTFYRR